MRYDQVRPFIKSGDLVLFRGRGLGAWLIRTWTRSWYAHAAIVWKVGDRLLLVESRVRTRGVAIGRPLSSAIKDGASWFQTRANWTPVAEEVALRELGTPYGWVDAIRAGLGLRTTSKGVQCAEYAAAVLQAACVNLRIDPATPDALARQMLEGVELVPG